MDWSELELGKQLADCLNRSCESSPNQESVYKKRSTKSNFSPSLAYGRHRGPSTRNVRRAAVIIALFQDNGEWALPLTVRPKSLQHHGGQICLPGGKIEESESSLDAAKREYREELGQEPQITHVCGQLSEQFVFGSNNLVRPVVVTMEEPLFQWNPDPVEVDEIVVLPLKKVLDLSSRVTVQQSKSVRQNGVVVDRMSYSVPAIEFEKHVIWGATALILDELAQILRNLRTC